MLRSLVRFQVAPLPKPAGNNGRVFLDAVSICDAVLPLEGCAIGVTADRRGEEQAELLRRMGATVTLGAAIRILALDDMEVLRAATDHVLANPPHVVLATTGIGIRSWIGAAESWGSDAALVGALSRAQVWARGPKAQAALVQFGIEPDYREPTERLDAMIEVLVMRGDLRGKRIALQLYGSRVPWAIDRLSSAGAEVVEIPVYRWLLPEDHQPAERIVQSVVDGRLDAITFTSPPAVRNLLNVADGLGMRAAMQHSFDHDVVVACVGPVTAEAALAAGIPVHASPGLGRLGLLVRSLTEVLRTRHVHLASSDGDAFLQGCLLVNTRGERATLSPRERAVLRVLLRRPGALIAKPTLLRDAWRHDPAAEVGALDAVVARLRRQLAPFGVQITARARRGYMLDAEVEPCGHAAARQDVVS